MKRILFGALAVLASLASVQPAAAGHTFGLFAHGPFGCHCNKCCEFRIRQYNAFTPVCSGSITCDGCMPFGSGMSGLNYFGVGSGPGGWVGNGFSCPGGYCGPAGGDEGVVADVGSSLPGLPPQMMPPAGPQMPTSTPFPQAPVSAPVLMPPGQGAAQPYYPGYNVQPVAYYPGYYPNYGYGYGYGYAPTMPTYPMPAMNYWNPMGQMPYYWNPMGGR